PAQQEDLHSLVAGGTRVMLVIAALVILIVIGVCVWVVLGSQGIVPAPEMFNGENAPLILGVMGIVLIFYVIMIGVSAARTRSMGSSNAKVKALTGKIKIKAQHMTGYSAAGAVASMAGAATTSYIVRVGKEKIYSTDDRVTEAFQEGILYRVYVVGRKPGYIIVSAEAMQVND
ncbi:MAG: hypothetical protein GC204_13905, partial [Chloroflexi bacterium]|nr:hypothetical protein [Chloroflexota bacterium]